MLSPCRISQIRFILSPASLPSLYHRRSRATTGLRSFRCIFSIRHAFSCRPGLPLGRLFAPKIPAAPFCCQQLFLASIVQTVTIEGSSHTVHFGQGSSLPRRRGRRSIWHSVPRSNTFPHRILWALYGGGHAGNLYSCPIFNYFRLVFPICLH